MLSHEGQYTCVVTNSAGEDKRDFHVTIQGVLQCMHLFSVTLLEKCKGYLNTFVL